jgi:hypothetical protein
MASRVVVETGNHTLLVALSCISYCAGRTALILQPAQGPFERASSGSLSRSQKPTFSHSITQGRSQPHAEAMEDGSGCGQFPMDHAWNPTNRRSINLGRLQANQAAPSWKLFLLLPSQTSPGVRLQSEEDVISVACIRADCWSSLTTSKHIMDDSVPSWRCFHATVSWTCAASLPCAAQSGPMSRFGIAMAGMLV